VPDHPFSYLKNISRLVYRIVEEMRIPKILFNFYDPYTVFWD